MKPISFAVVWGLITSAIVSLLIHLPGRGESFLEDFFEFFQKKTSLDDGVYSVLFLIVLIALFSLVSYRKLKREIVVPQNIAAGIANMVAVYIAVGFAVFVVVTIILLYLGIINFAM